MKLSRYAFLFNKGGVNLLYSSRMNNFYEVSDRLFDFLKNNLSETSLSLLTESEREDVDTLLKAKIIVCGNEDDEFLEDLQLSYLMKSFSTKTVLLTVLPTITCNLRCPYCFEENKPKGMMSKETADALVKFLSQHEESKNYSLTWFGGEPLLGIDIIGYLLDKLDNLEGLTRRGHSIVTDGTLLQGRNIDIFERFPLDSVQITFDGKKKSHDSKRFFQSGEGSFDLILRNLDEFMERCPETAVSIRVNVDNSNQQEYFDMSDFLYDRYQGKKLSVYSAPLRANPGCDTPVFFSPGDVAAFYKRLFSRSGKFGYYPSFSGKGCTATCVAGYVIGPEGEIYRCWEHVGKPDCVIGNINEARFSNQPLFNRFIFHGHCFDDEVCRKCGFLPVCSGGCPAKRIEANGDRSHLCTMLNHKDGEALEDFLYEYYLSETSKE